MSCEDLQQKIHELADGELAPGEERSVRDHLAGCEACRREHEEVLHLKSLVRAVAGRPAVPGSVLAAVQEGSSSAAGRRSVIRRIATSWWSAAAALLVVALTALAFFAGNVGPSGPQLVHASMLRGCLEVFEDLESLQCVAADPLPADQLSAAIAEDLERHLVEIGIDEVPVLERVSYCGISRYRCPRSQGLRGVRLDFLAQETPETPERRISLFVLPLEPGPLGHKIAREVEREEHVCRCLDTHGKTIYCTVSSGYVLNIIADLEESALLAKLRCKKAER